MSNMTPNLEKMWSEVQRSGSWSQSGWNNCEAMPLIRVQTYCWHKGKQSGEAGASGYPRCCLETVYHSSPDRSYQEDAQGDVCRRRRGRNNCKRDQITPHETTTLFTFWKPLTTKTASPCREITLKCSQLLNTNDMAFFVIGDKIHWTRKRMFFNANCV